MNSWEIGGGYNIINDGKSYLNITAYYNQKVSKDSVGNLMNPPTGSDEHEKYFAFIVTGGYNFDEVTVFGKASYYHQVDGEKNTEKFRTYNLEAGVYKEFNDRIAARTSLAADIDETDRLETETYWWNVGAEYSFAKNMSFGANASYMLDNDAHRGVSFHSGYKINMEFKAEF